jgi:hypothetical protein
MKWKSIRLELGGTSEFPAGSVGRAYLLRLPLDDQDKVDAEAFDHNPLKATVRRHWSNEPDERGHVQRDGADWVLRCNGKSHTVRFEWSRIRLGGKLQLVGADGEALPFRIASIR